MKPFSHYLAILQVKFSEFQANPALQIHPFEAACPDVKGIEPHHIQASFKVSNKNP